MSSLVGDLWPIDLVDRPTSSPTSIMKEQAARLAGKTGDLVLADVRPKVSAGTVNLSFDLVMPLMENYRYPLLKVTHGVEGFYPLTIEYPGEEGLEYQSCQDETSFLSHFKTLLNSDRVKNIVRTFVDMQVAAP